jgi:uncharacterized RDD family membrane protein YckC
MNPKYIEMFAFTSESPETGHFFLFCEHLRTGKTLSLNLAGTAIGADLYYTSND